MRTLQSLISFCSSSSCVSSHQLQASRQVSADRSIDVLAVATRSVIPRVSASESATRGRPTRPTAICALSYGALAHRRPSAVPHLRTDGDDRRDHDHCEHGEDRAGTTQSIHRMCSRRTIESQRMERSTWRSVRSRRCPSSARSSVHNAPEPGTRSFITMYAPSLSIESRSSSSY